LVKQKSLIRVDNIYGDLKSSTKLFLTDGTHTNSDAQKIIMNTIRKKLYPLLEL